MSNKEPVKQKRAKKLDLSTAKVVDGALQSPTSVYEVCGIQNNLYLQKDLASYKKAIAAMDLVELQDHAYHIGVTPNPNYDIMIDRLERKFIQENPRPTPPNGVAMANGDAHLTIDQIMYPRR